MKKPNAWGLHDMAGNLWEWCKDWYGKYDGTAQTDPQGPPAGSVRVLRGGTCNASPRNSRSAYRIPSDPGARAPTNGFRVVLDAELKEAAKVAVEDLKAGKWESLFDGKTLDGWRAAEGGLWHGGHGKIEALAGRIVLGGGANHTGIVSTRKLPTMDYEISVEAMRIEGIDSFCSILFPVGSSDIALGVGGWAGGREVGLEMVDGRGGGANVTTRQMDFERGRWYRVRVRVTKARIQAWIDNTKVIDLETAGHTFDAGAGFAPLRPMGLDAAHFTAALRNIRLRRIGD
jgi:hypothetical protein